MTRRTHSQNTTRMYESMTFSFTPLRLEDYQTKKQEFSQYHCGRAIHRYWSAVGADIASATNKILQYRPTKS